MRASSQAEGPADAKEQDGAGERSEEEVLQPALVAVAIGLVEAGHDVGRHHHQLETQEERDQVARRGEDAHSQQAEDQDRVELTEGQAPDAQIGGREEGGEDADQHRRAFEEDRQVIDLVEAAEQIGVGAPHDGAGDPGQDQPEDGERGQDPLEVTTQEEIDGDHHQHEHGQDELGQEGKELVEVVHRRIGPTTAGSGR